MIYMYMMIRVQVLAAVWALKGALPDPDDETGSTTSN